MNKVESNLRHFATSRCSQSLQKHFTDAADEIARLEALADAVRKQTAAECAKICEGFIDAKEQGRASLAAAKAIKEGGQRDTIDRLSHEGTVSLYNGTLQRCARAIKKAFWLDAEGVKE